MWDKKWFGFWREDGDYYSNCPSILEWIDVSTSIDFKKKIINYLDGGGFVAASPVNVVCHLCNDNIDSSKVILTDGTWIWPKDLTHYIRSHKLQIPKEFYRHIKENQFECPEIYEDFDIMRLEHP